MIPPIEINCVLYIPRTLNWYSYLREFRHFKQWLRFGEGYLTASVRGHVKLHFRGLLQGRIDEGIIKTRVERIPAPTLCHVKGSIDWHGPWADQTNDEDGYVDLTAKRGWVDAPGSIGQPLQRLHGAYVLVHEPQSFIHEGDHLARIITGQDWRTTHEDRILSPVTGTR